LLTFLGLNFQISALIDRDMLQGTRASWFSVREQKCAAPSNLIVRVCGWNRAGKSGGGGTVWGLAVQFIFHNVILIILGKAVNCFYERLHFLHFPKAEDSFRQ